MTCDGRLFHRRAAATETLCRLTWTDETLMLNVKCKSDYSDQNDESLLGNYTKKGTVLIIYIAVLRNRGLLQDRFKFNNTPLIIGPIHGSYKQRLSI